MLNTHTCRIVTAILGCFAWCINCDSSSAQSYGSAGGGTYGNYSSCGCDDCCSARCGRHARVRRSSSSCGCSCCGGSVAMSWGAAGGNYNGMGMVVGDASTQGGAGTAGGAMQLPKPTPPGEADWESIFITVSVPEEAKVIVNQKPTVSEGKTREFVIRALEPGKEYKFEIRAEMVNAGGIFMEDVKTVTLLTGTREQLVLVPIRKRKKPAEAPNTPDAQSAEEIPPKLADRTRADAKKVPAT